MAGKAQVKARGSTRPQRWSRVRRLGSLLTLAWGLLWASPRSAWAWRQYHTKDSALACAEQPTACGCGLRWYAGQIDYRIDSAGLEQVALADVQTAVAAAWAPWQAVNCALCSSADGPGCPPVTCAPAPLGLAFQ